MEFKEVIKTRLRMCVKYECVGCPVITNPGDSMPCKVKIFSEKNYMKTEKIIEQWAKDNPAKTYWDVFKERNPDVSDYDKRFLCRNEKFDMTTKHCTKKFHGNSIMDTCIDLECRECKHWDKEYKVQQ